MDTTTVISVNNAGVVLLYSHIPALFESLGLTAGNEFINAAAQVKAVHSLQYAATGIAGAEDSELVLAKLLCGLHPDEPLHDEAVISEEQAKLIDELVGAATTDWQETAGSSLHDFRGDWIARLGTVTEYSDEWDLEPSTGEDEEEELVAESSGASPKVKYPWMPKSAEAKYPWMPKGAEHKYPWMPKNPEAKYPWMPKAAEGKYPWMPKGPEIKYPWMPKSLHVNWPER